MSIYTTCICICGLRYPRCNAHAPCYHLWPAPLYNFFSPHCLINGTIFEKKIIEHNVDHLIFQCERLKYERGILKNSVLKAGNWPISKSELINKYLKQFIRYINSMDLEKLNHSNEELQMNTYNRYV